jgi:hypothetical protein
MGTSSRQDSAFIESLISSTLLEEAIEWISSNMSPEDVFSTTDLRDWATSNGFEEFK